MDEQQKSKPAHQPGTTKGEDVVKKKGQDPGMVSEGSKGEAKRPTGMRTARSSTGVNPKDPIDPKSPNMPTP